MTTDTVWPRVPDTTRPEGWSFPKQRADGQSADRSLVMTPPRFLEQYEHYAPVRACVLTLP
jgi:hypothetical protein